MKFTIIIPMFNEESVIRGFLSKVTTSVKEVAHIIVVDDNSTDDSKAIVQSFENVDCISHSVNKGYGAALKTGISHAKTEYVMFADADGQHRIEDIMSLLEYGGEYDMLVGARGSDSHKPLIRRPGKWILKNVVNILSHKKIPDFNSGLRIVKTQIIRQYLHLMPNGFSFSTTSTVALNNMGYDVKYTRILVEKRSGRNSNVRIFSDGMRTLKLIIGLTMMFNSFNFFVIPSLVMLIAPVIIFFIMFIQTGSLDVTDSMVVVFVTGFQLFMIGILADQISEIRKKQNI
jgi:glycosyltransferase involved in cell wall biosynthesis